MLRRLHRTGFTVLLAAALLAHPAAQAPVRATVAVAAASDLQTVLPPLAAAFEQATGTKLQVSFGSSGSIFAQIQHGAPFDVFFSADEDYPRRLVTAGLAERDTLYAYGTGQLVLWTRTDSGLDLRSGLAALRDPRVRRIALANPDLAPYGRAAVAALQSAGVDATVRDRLVFGENIAQAAQLAESGNADVGIISHSLALGPVLQARGSFVPIPAAHYPPIVQAAVVVAGSRNAAAGRALVRYLQGADARRTLAAFGFGPPPQR